MIQASARSDEHGMAAVSPEQAARRTLQACGIRSQDLRQPGAPVVLRPEFKQRCARGSSCQLEHFRWHGGSDGALKDVTHAHGRWITAALYGEQACLLEAEQSRTSALRSRTLRCAATGDVGDSCR